MFVIQVINETGELERKAELPYYGATMESASKGGAAFEELEDALKVLQIHKAKSIQFIADGATAYWANIKSVFLNAGIELSKVTFTLDYYHAAQHLHELVQAIPNMNDTQRTKFVEELKEDLFHGTIYSLTTKVKKQLQGYHTNYIKKELDYFTKHHDHMRYKKFKHNKWLLGSGLVESAIRRIINLRFKSASSFWTIQTLDQLIRLRAAFLAGRWNFFIRFLAMRNLGTI